MRAPPRAQPPGVAAPGAVRTPRSRRAATPPPRPGRRRRRRARSARSACAGRVCANRVRGSFWWVRAPRPWSLSLGGGSQRRGNGPAADGFKARKAASRPGIAEGPANSRRGWRRGRTLPQFRSKGAPHRASTPSYLWVSLRLCRISLFVTTRRLVQFLAPQPSLFRYFFTRTLFLPQSNSPQRKATKIRELIRLGSVFNDEQNRPSLGRPFLLDLPVHGSFFCS